MWAETWEQGAMFCEPYITLDEFLRVQANRQTRTLIRDELSPRVLSSHVLLSGLVICGHCLAKGKRVTVTARVDQRRRDTSWYICGIKLRQRGKDCDLPRVACWLLEDTIIQALLSSALTPEYIWREIGEAQRLLDERRPMLHSQLARLERETAEKEAAVRELLQLIQK
jgi:Recombinase zinc beta ribbon domain